MTTKTTYGELPVGAAFRFADEDAGKSILRKQTDRRAVVIETKGWTETDSPVSMWAGDEVIQVTKEDRS